jgi:hypothetical protein
LTLRQPVLVREALARAVEVALYTPIPADGAGEALGALLDLLNAILAQAGDGAHALLTADGDLIG